MADPIAEINIANTASNETPDQLPRDLSSFRGWQHERNIVRSGLAGIERNKPLVIPGIV